MAIGSKGQFYIIAMVFMVSVAIGMAYFTSESKQLGQQTEIEIEPGLQLLMTSFELELKGSLAGGFYSGDGTFYVDVAESLVNRSAERGYNFTYDCTKTDISASSAELSCNLTLTVNDNVIYANFTDYFYAVDFDVDTYADGNLTDVTDYFLLGDMVYYRLTTQDVAEEVNVSVFYPNGTMMMQELKTPVDFVANGSFNIGASDPTGEWEIGMNNTVRELVPKKKFSVQLASIEIDTFDSNDNRRDTFDRGELVKYAITVNPSANVYVDVTANGQKRDYGWVSSSSSTTHYSNFTIDLTESTGTLTITTTEDNYFESNSTDITVLEAPYGTFINVGLDFTFPYVDAFVTACGYTTWYTDASTDHSGVLFAVENSTENAVIRVDHETEEVTLPQTYAQKIHFISSRCGSC